MIFSNFREINMGSIQRMQHKLILRGVQGKKNYGTRLKPPHFLFHVCVHQIASLDNLCCYNVPCTKHILMDLRLIILFSLMHLYKHLDIQL